MENKENEPEDVKFLDLFNPNSPRSDEELIKSRLDICNQCPYLGKKLKRCGLCGCFMSLKTTLLEAKCPIDKW
jgi:hypothetical protein